MLAKYIDCVLYFSPKWFIDSKHVVSLQHVDNMVETIKLIKYMFIYSTSQNSVIHKILDIGLIKVRKAH